MRPGRSPATGASLAGRVMACALHAAEILAALAFAALVALDIFLPAILGGAGQSSAGGHSTVLDHTPPTQSAGFQAEPPSAPAAAPAGAPLPASAPADWAAWRLPADESGVLGEPFLLDVRQDQITVAVLADRPLRATIGYGDSIVLAGPFPNVARTGEPRPIRGTGMWVADATITGLTADTVYFYRLREPVRREPRMFRTARPAGESFRFVVTGGSAGDPALHAAACRRIEAIQPVPQFVLHAGACARRDWAAEFFGPASGLLQKVALVPVVADDASRQAFAPLAANPYYALPLGAGRLLCLDTRAEQPYAPGSNQYVWLVGQLSPPRSGWTFVALLRSPYSLGRADEAVRRHLVPLFEQYGVDAVFCGTDRGYQRAEWGGVLYFSLAATASPADEPVGRIPGWLRIADLATKQTDPQAAFLQVDANNEHVTYAALAADDGGLIEQLSRARKPGDSRFDAVARTLEWARSDEASQRQWAAARLVDHPDDADLKTIQDLAADTDPYVRVCAVRALTRRNGVNSAGAVLTRLKQQDAATMAESLEFFAAHPFSQFAPQGLPAALHILAAGPDGGLSDPRASRRLLEALTAALSRNPSATNAAALQRIWSGPRIIADVRAAALRGYLQQTAPDQRPPEWRMMPLEAGLPRELRCVAAEELGRLGTAEALRLLVAVLQQPDAPQAVADAARSAVADFQPAGDTAALVELLQVAQEQAQYVPEPVGRRIVAALQHSERGPTRALASGALTAVPRGQLAAYLSMHRRLTDAARHVAIALAWWLIVSRLLGLIRPGAYVTHLRCVPVRSLNVVAAVGAAAFGVGWWLTASVAWAWAAAAASAAALWLGRRWLGRHWPPLDAEEFPEAAPRHAAARCRIICALTVAAAAAMMIIAFAVGY